MHLNTIRQKSIESCKHVIDFDDAQSLWDDEEYLESCEKPDEPVSGIGKIKGRQSRQ